MQRSTEEQQRRHALEDEVKKLQVELEGEETLRHVLQYALDGPMLSHPCLSSFLPPHVQVLLSELVMIQEEIFLLERKVDELKLKLCQERAAAREREIRQQKRVLQQQNNTNTLCEVANDQRSRSQNYKVLRQERVNHP